MINTDTVKLHLQMFGTHAKLRRLRLKLIQQMNRIEKTCKRNPVLWDAVQGLVSDVHDTLEQR